MPLVTPLVIDLNDDSSDDDVTASRGSGKKVDSSLQFSIDTLLKDVRASVEQVRASVEQCGFYVGLLYKPLSSSRYKPLTGFNLVHCLLGSAR